MPDAATGQPAWSRPADRAILEFLVDQRAEYPAIVANRTGMHTTHVEKRCAELAERGLLEAVSGEIVYRVTDAGRRAVDRGRLPE